MSKLNFQISVDGIAVAVTYWPCRFSGHDHFEFTHPTEAKKPIPISHTGYRSHIAHGSFIEAAGGPEAFAKAYCRAVLNAGDSGPPDDDEEAAEQAAAYQPSLFD